MKLDELVKQLQMAYADALRSVVLFGSAVAGEHRPNKSDYNVLVIVDGLPLDRLRAVAAVSKAWAEDGNPPPMTFTTREWKSSADIFRWNTPISWSATGFFTAPCQSTE